MDMNKFGERLGVYRQNKGFTQEEFAFRMGVTPQAISKWERGQSLPDLSFMNGICSVLDIDANEMLDILPVHLKEENDTSLEASFKSGLCTTEPIQILIGKNLIPVFQEGLKADIFDKKREYLMRKKGFLIPVIKIRDDVDMEDNGYRILLYDKEFYKEVLGVIDETSFITIVDQLFAACRDNYNVILNKQIVKELIDNTKNLYPAISEDVIPQKIPYLFIKKVLLGLVNKNVSIHNLIHILETVEDEVIFSHNDNVDSIVNKILLFL